MSNEVKVVSFLFNNVIICFLNLVPFLVNPPSQIPRIILTHPSTSDEDIEPLTQESAGLALDDADDPDTQIYSECYNNAFSPA